MISIYHNKKKYDYHQNSAITIDLQQHYAGWALPNTKQAFQEWFGIFFDERCAFCSLSFLLPCFAVYRFPGVLRHVLPGRTIYRTVLTCFPRIDGNHKNALFPTMGRAFYSIKY